MTRQHPWALALFFTLVAVEVSSAEARIFNSPCDKVFAAARASIQARGSIVAENQEKGLLQFVVAPSEGVLGLTPVSNSCSADVSMQEPSRMHDAMFGRHGAPAKQILDRIEAALKGKEIKADERLQRKSAELAGKIEADASHGAPGANLRASGAAPAASIVIRGTREAVASTLVRGCASRGWAIASETEHQITITRNDPADQNWAWLVSTLLIGDRTTQRYRTNVQFILAVDGPNVSVGTAAEVVTQDGYGRTNSFNVTNDARVVQILQSLLDGLKTTIETAPRGSQ